MESLIVCLPSFHDDDGIPKSERNAVVSSVCGTSRLGMQ